MPLAEAVRYVLRIPTNTLLIISCSLGYCSFAGLQTFAIVFIRSHYHASQATATLILGLLVLGFLIGTLLSGPMTDLLARRGWIAARTWIRRCATSVPADCWYWAFSAAA